MQTLSMTTIVLAGVAISLLAIAVILKARARKPKRVEKWEKAQIVKRLVALSEREDISNGISRQRSAPQTTTPHRPAAAAKTSSRTVSPA